MNLNSGQRDTVSQALGRAERRPCSFEDAISDADFLDDGAYAFYTRGAPSPKLSLWRAPRAVGNMLAEIARLIALVGVVSMLALFDTVAGNPRA